MKKKIIVENVSKRYKLYKNSKERLLDLFTPQSYGESFYALKNVNFIANQGEVVGFIGINGSGKSTLSNIIAGVVPETSGILNINGDVSLIAVAAGLKNELTGRENIELKLLMLGFNKIEIEELEDSIIEFSELGKFIDQPVKSYSSGMKSRLGFSISVSVNPDILIIDEALSVGDRAFAEKSLNKMIEFKKAGKTMIFVSHSLGQMKSFCDKILWLEYGKVKAYGTVEEIIPQYETFLNMWRDMSQDEKETYQKNQVIPDRFTSKINNSKEVQLIIEKPVSILGHFKTKDSYIYTHKDNLKEKENAEKYKNKVYFIKKQAIIQGIKFYLISLNPSAEQGVIGWVKAEDMNVHRHVFVDRDTKKMTLSGNGAAYDLPWGGERNCLLKDLMEYKGKEILILETHLVGNNIWFYGELDSKKFWIHDSSINY